MPFPSGGSPPTFEAQETTTITTADWAATLVSAVYAETSGSLDFVYQMFVTSDNGLDFPNQMNISGFSGFDITDLLVSTSDSGFSVTLVPQPQAR